MYTAYRVSQLFLQVELWIFLCFLVAGFLAARRRFVASRRFLLLGILLFYAVSIPPTAKALIGSLESSYPTFTPTGKQSYHAIVVLAGAIRWQPATDSATILGTESLDRLICGIDLFRQAPAPVLVLSGGVVDPSRPTLVAASAMKDEAVRLGFPESAILTETNSRNTAENAREVRRVLPDAKRIVLTTSAYHLPRGIAVFEKQGFSEVVPAPCSYEIAGHDFVVGDVFPGADSMRVIDAAIHEYVGIALYRALGKM